MATPSPLINRIVAVKNEMAGKINACQVLDAAQQVRLQWYGKLLTAMGLCQRDGLNKAGKDWCESLLVACYRDCGTSLDLTGMIFINVYVCDRKMDEEGCLVEFRKHIAYKVCEEGPQAHIDLTTIRGRYMHPPRAESELDRADGYQPRFVVLMEDTCPTLVGIEECLN